MPHTISGGTSTPLENHYDVLNLPDPRNGPQDLSAQRLKAAYRTSLLLYHPDKAHKGDRPTQAPSNGESRKAGTIYSVDQISQAYAVLSVPKLRAQYDRELLLNAKLQAEGLQEREIFRTGVEIVDLDDLVYDEEQTTWYRSCRCGDERGFLVREEDLEEVADDGEVNVGCKGCSLWMKILFGVMEEEGEQHGKSATPGH